MRIAINALFLIPNRVGGSETYVRGLVQALGSTDSDNEYILFLGPESAPTLRRPNTNWRVVTSPAASVRRPIRLALEQLWLPRVATKLGADVIHSMGYTGPLASRQARVTSIHDMNYKRHPEDLSVAERTVYSALIPLVAIRSHRVLTLTGAARRDVLHWTNAAPGNVGVVHAGVREWWPGEPRDDLERLRAAGVSEPFVLSVAASYPHKNLDRLVGAFPLYGDGRQPVRLVLVGLKGRGHRAIAAACERHPDTIKVLGWVDDALLASLYRRSLGLAFPSLYEGFGLPILEAMALGTPVLTSNRGAMAEVADGAAELVDPYDVAAIRAGLQRLVTDASRREELRRLGTRRAAHFSWERAARETLTAYAEAAAAVSHR